MIDQKKKRKEKRLRKNRFIHSSTKAGRSKPLFQGRFIRTSLEQRTNNITTNIFLSNFSKLASLFQKKIYFSILLFSCPLHVYSSTNKLKKKQINRIVEGTIAIYDSLKKRKKGKKNRSEYFERMFERRRFKYSELVHLAGT